MIPILFDKNETDFENNGLGRLRECISCICSEERNGLYEVDFEYPVSADDFNDIQIGRIIGVTHDESDDIQPFDIVSYSKPINGIVTFHCTHISYRQSYLTVTGRNVTSLASAFSLFSYAEPTNPFSYQTDMTPTGYMASVDGLPHTIRSLLGGIEGSVLDAYGGEFEWDKWTVNLWYERGQTRDFTIRYGLNMLDYNEDLDTQGTYSSCIPYWTDGTTKVIGNKVNGNGSTITGRGECMPLDLSDKFETQPTQAQVEALALSYMNSNTPFMPTQNIHVEFARLQDIGYEGFENLLECNLCDTINVVFPDYNSTGQFKIVKTVWDVLRDRYESMELGDLSVTLAEALGVNSVNGEINPTLADLAYDSGVVTVYGDYCKCRRMGHAVHVWGESFGGWSITQGDYRAMTTLREEFRPAQNVRFVCGAFGGTQQITGYIDTSGVVYLYTTATTGYWNFSIMYLVG